MVAIRGFINKNDQADSLVKEQNAHLDSLSEMANIKVNLLKKLFELNFDTLPQSV
ncbi:hypothetical protein [uncultured Chryseobacterium sp.]|uniref:hypothetical protein n=1 Tax=uncultured Chryseobacterium sp. TaxID=259322 RepID=UPI0025FC2404|nr:hypothetical protein [uncultured Chryseobacterium sp.]